jgi:hypothetical protein
MGVDLCISAWKLCANGLPDNAESDVSMANSIAFDSPMARLHFTLGMPR